MATKKPSAATQLKNVLTENKDLKVQVEKLTKDLASTTSTKDYCSRRAETAEKEVESVHSILDVLPGAIARKTVPDPEQSYNIVTHNLLTRFAGFLAVRN